MPQPGRDRPEATPRAARRGRCHLAALGDGCSTSPRGRPGSFPIPHRPGTPRAYRCAERATEGRGMKLASASAVSGPSHLRSQSIRRPQLVGHGGARPAGKRVVGKAEDVWREHAAQAQGWRQCSGDAPAGTPNQGANIHPGAHLCAKQHTGPRGLAPQTTTGAGSRPKSTGRRPGFFSVLRTGWRPEGSVGRVEAGWAGGRLTAWPAGRGLFRAGDPCRRRKPPLGPWSRPSQAKMRPPFCCSEVLSLRPGEM
jgi:hypothetical protein